MSVLGTTQAVQSSEKVPGPSGIQQGLPWGVIIQSRHLPSGLTVIGQSYPRIKGDATGASVDATIQRKSTYLQTIRRSIYETRRPENPHYP